MLLFVLANVPRRQLSLLHGRLRAREQQCRISTIGSVMSTPIWYVDTACVIKYSDGKADPVLVERWINTPYSRGMIHFFHPGLVKRAGASTFFCQGTNLRVRCLTASRLAGQHWISASSPRRKLFIAPIADRGTMALSQNRACDTLIRKPLLN